jgi:hypothetical protein
VRWISSHLCSHLCISRAIAPARISTFLVQAPTKKRISLRVAGAAPRVMSLAEMIARYRLAIRMRATALYHHPRALEIRHVIRIRGPRRNKRRMSFLTAVYVGKPPPLAAAKGRERERERGRPPLSKISQAAGRVYEYWHVGERERPSSLSLELAGAHKGEHPGTSRPRLSSSSSPPRRPLSKLGTGIISRPSAPRN